MFSKVVFLIVLGFVQARAAAVGADVIKSTLDQQQIDLESARKEDVYKVYQANNFNPLFFKPGSTGIDLQQLTELRKLAQYHALNGTFYFPEYFDTCSQKYQEVVCEVLMTQAVIKLGTHLFRGQLLPTTVDPSKNRLKLRLKTFLKDSNGKASDRYPQLVQAILGGTSSLLQFLNDLSPKNPAYANTLRIYHFLNEQMQKGNQFEAIPNPGVDLSLGMNHPTIYAVKNTLRVLGFQIQNLDQQFDAELASAIKEIQLATLLTPTGKIETIPSSGNDGGPQGNRSLWLNYFNYSLTDRINQVQADLEKLRWLPQSFENKYIFVNLANQTLQLIENGRVGMKLLTVNGRVNEENDKENRPTPMMRSFIDSLDLNPYWTVPTSILAKDKLPILKGIENKFRYDEDGRDPAIRKWFRANNFELAQPAVDDNGKQMFDEFGRLVWQPYSSDAVRDWGAVSVSNFPFSLRQRPGLSNALGVVRFNLSGDSSIYLHDTNEREYFDKPYRLRSSGCIRVNRALELAATLAQDSSLCDDQYCLENSSPLQELKKLVPPFTQDKILKTTKVKLNKNIFVYLVYLTTTQNKYFSSSPPIGIQFHPDFYKQNEMILSALSKKVD